MMALELFFVWHKLALDIEDLSTLKEPPQKCCSET